MSKQLSSTLLSQYNQASVNIKDKLMAQCQEDTTALKRYQAVTDNRDIDITHLQHKINVTHRILTHEWKMNIQTLL